MMHNNDVGNSEENGFKPRMDRDKDVSVPNEKFLSKEPIVLVSIVCLSLMNGLCYYLQAKSSREIDHFYVTIYHRVWITGGPVVGVIFAALIMEVTGRKHMYRYFFALSAFASILFISSNNPIFLSVIILCRGIIRGASFVMGATAVCEYSSPKHRFTWLIFNNAASNITSHLMFAIPFDSDTLMYVLIAIQTILGLICSGSTWVWPESPYWLVNNYKHEQSKEAFMWLRSKEGREELAAVLKARRRPGPAKLFWISLLVALAAMLVSTFSLLQKTQSTLLYFELTHYMTRRESQVYIELFGTLAITCILAALSYFAKRKLVFIVVSITSFVLCYAEALCMYFTPESDMDGILFYLVHVASDVVLTSGPLALGEILSIEITPHKYNTRISCICYTVMLLTLSILLVLFLFLFRFLHPSVLLSLSTTFALVAALLYYFFAPETKDKTLLEIQRSYTPGENNSIPEQNQSMMLNVI